MRHVTTRNVELTDFAQMYRHMRMYRKLIELALYLRITVTLKKLYRAMFHEILAANKLILQVTNTCLTLMFLSIVENFSNLVAVKSFISH